MRRRLRRVLVLLALAVAYLLVFPVPTRRELVVGRAWATDVASAPVSAGGEPAVPFSFPSVFGYISPGGAVLHRGTVTHGVAISLSGFVSYGRTPDQLVIQNPDGSYQSTVPYSGYPHFTGDRLFVTGAGAGTVSFPTGPEGQFVTRELQGGLTALQADGGLTVAGMLSGGMAVFGRDGQRLEVQGVAEASPTVAYGVAVHEPSGRVAAAYGPLDPALVLYSVRDATVVPELRVELSSVPGSSVAMSFINNGDQVIVRDGSLVRIISTEDGTQVSVPVTHEVRQVEGFSDGMALALTRGDVPDPRRGFRTPAEIVVFDASGTAPVRAAFAADATFLCALDGQPVLGLDGRVLRLTLGVE